ncbi:hypothetical protein PMIN06_005294 [Paraphaeosphaeria minitans]
MSSGDGLHRRIRLTESHNTEAGDCHGESVHTRRVLQLLRTRGGGAFETTTRVRASRARAEIQSAEEEEDDAAPETDLPELKDDDNESVVSLDVGFSQEFTSS